MSGLTAATRVVFPRWNPTWMEGINQQRPRRPIVRRIFQMLARKAAFPSTRRAAAIAVAAALALTAVVPSVASAGSATHGKGLTAATGGMTDISARRRGFNPGVAAVAGVVGLGIAAATAANANAYYDGGYGYYDAPGPV